MEKKLTYAQQKFRKLCLMLIASDKKREMYLQEEYEEEFGSEFFHQLQKLITNFVAGIEVAAPPTMISRVSLVFQLQQVNPMNPRSGFLKLFS